MKGGTRTGLRAVGEGRAELLGHRQQVESVREVLARAGQHDGADLVVRVESPEDVGQLTPEVGSHRIALARADERHLCDVTLDVHDDGFAYRP